MALHCHACSFNTACLTSSLILGLLWGLWHMPLFLTPETFQSQLPFVGFLLSAVATSIMHTLVVQQYPRQRFTCGDIPRCHRRLHSLSRRYDGGRRAFLDFCNGAMDRCRSDHLANRRTAPHAEDGLAWTPDCFKTMMTTHTHRAHRSM